MSLKSHQKDWEDLGELDPLWAVLSDNDKRDGKWKLEAFLKTGEDEISRVLDRLEKQKISYKTSHALDFGCGVGRLSLALSAHFDQVTGVDISEPMLEKARELSANNTKCEYKLNTVPHLKQFPDNHFNLIYSNITLQHVPDISAIHSYIQEFVRTLTPGGVAIFQIPSQTSWKVGLNPRRRLWKLLKMIGFNSKTLLQRFKLSPIHMSVVPRTDVIKLVDTAGGKILGIVSSQVAGPKNKSLLYFVTKEK